MKIVPIVLLAAGLALAQAAPQREFWSPARETIEGHLGRPYVWGSSGLKSFDCSGFLWRVMLENGILTKRTTARKYYMSLPKTAGARENYRFGNVVFFDNLKHVGIVNDPGSFYHAQTHAGTNLSRFDPFWRAKVFGFRAVRPAVGTGIPARPNGQ